MSNRGREEVEVFCDGQMYVQVETDDALGFSEDIGGPVQHWLPFSQILGVAPEEGDWVENLRIPRWLADSNGLYYEEC